MDWTTTLGIIASIITIISIPTIILFYTDKLPYVKKIGHIIFNKTYNVQLKGVKEYALFSHDLKLIKTAVLGKYPIKEINTLKKNSMTN